MAETLLILAALAVAALFLLRRKPAEFAEPQTVAVDPRTLSAFEAQPSLFANSSELAMFAALERAVPSTHRVMAKVRLEDVIGVKRGVSGEARWKLRARVKSRHLDFLITNLRGSPCVAVELDGGSHDRRRQSAGARNADALKDALFARVGIPLVRVRVGEDFADRARGIAELLTKH